MAKLEELEEVDLSGNLLKTVPTTIMNCRRMHTLIAHSNAIEVFPEVMQLMEMKVRQNTAYHVGLSACSYRTSGSNCVWSSFPPSPVCGSEL